MKISGGGAQNRIFLMVSRRLGQMDGKIVMMFAHKSDAGSDFSHGFVKISKGGSQDYNEVCIEVRFWM